MAEPTAVEGRPGPGVLEDPEPRGLRSGEAWPARALAALGSIRVAMVLMGLGILLVLAGTLAQVDTPLSAVQKAYFRSWFVHVQAWHVVLPGGYLLGAAMLVNLTAATFRRPLSLTPRHLGPFLGHLAIALFLVSELATSVLARETTMEINEGQTATYSFATDEVELAVVDASPGDHDRVVAVSQRLLRDGRRVETPALPFSLEVVGWLPASTLVASSPVAPALATEGVGTRWTAVEAPASRGDVPDFPSAYVRVLRGGQDLGTLLVSLHVVEPQRVVVDGRPYDLSLRFRRFYKPFSLRLEDFAHDRYTGTSVARNFSSRVHLVDRGLGEDREVVISMNQPLRHRGEAFYQSAFKNDDRTTVLQVVKNPGWTVPYLAMGVGTLGMGLFFGQALARFIRRGRS